MGYNFIVEYKKGSEKKVADALSRKEDTIVLEQGNLAAIAFPTLQWMEELKASYHNSPKILKLWNQLKNQQEAPRYYTLKQDLILKKGRLLIVPESQFK